MDSALSLVFVIEPRVLSVRSLQAHHCPHFVFDRQSMSTLQRLMSC